MVLSIVIPVYNTLEYLPQCLESIEKQGFNDLEIILVDDGSTDGSSNLCDLYRDQHKNVKVIHKKNGGAADSRNAGLLAASGEYIHFIDSDDALVDDGIYKYFFDIIFPQKPDVVLARFEEYSPDLSVLEEIQPKYKIEGLFEGNTLNNVLRNHYSATLTSPVNKFFSRTLLIKNDLFFSKGIDHEEDEWLPRVLACTNRTWFCNSVIYRVRKGRKGSLSETLNEQDLARKSCSKIKIAATGIEYMKLKCLSASTLALVCEYYWDYLVDACVACSKMISIKTREQIYRELRENSSFFDSYKYLNSKNRRILGILFKTFGIKFTIKLIGIRYGKQT